MVLGKFTLREIRSRPGRAILTLLSVIIGVSTVVAIGAATGTTHRALSEMSATVNGRAALEIMSEAGAPFDQAVLARVRQTAGVAAAVPVIRQSAILYYGIGQRVTVTLLGIDPSVDGAVRDQELAAGKPLEGDKDELIVERGFAEKLGIKPGDQVRLLTRSGRKKFTIAGLIAPKTASALGQPLVSMSLRTAQRRLRSASRIDGIQVVPAESVDLDQLEATLKAELPPGLAVLRATSRKSLADETLLSTGQALMLATCFSWLLSVLIVLNTFQMNVVERRRQLAIMRAIGATRRQVLRIVALEGLTMGLVGTVLGVLVGLGGAKLLSLATGQLLQMSMPTVQIDARTLLLALMVGPAISLLGAIFPAWRASRLSPLEGMGAVLPADMETPPWTAALAGVAVVLAGVALLVASVAGRLPVNVSVVAALMILFGLILLIPIALVPLVRASFGSISWLAGIEGRLAQGQIVRRRGRTTLTVGVLFLALAFGIGMANTITATINDVRRWSRTAAQGDYFVRAMMPDMNTGLAADLPEAVGAELRTIPGISGLQSVRFAKLNLRGQGVIILAGDFGAADQGQFAFELASGDSADAADAVRRGEALIGTVFALRAGLKVGDQLQLETPEGPRRIRVAGTVNDYIAGGLTMYLEKQVARRLLGIDGVDAYVIWASPGKKAEVGQALQALALRHGLLLQARDEVMRMIDSMMMGVVGCLWFLLVIVFIVAAFGMVNTLTMNVIEQTRELGLLRIVAMTRRQVRKMILAQAAILALIGLAPGVLAGLAVAWLMNLAAEPMLGHPMEFVARGWLVAGCFAVAFSIVLAAAWFPASRAARLELAEALQYQ